METQQTEYKALWKDEYLKWVCGFANAQGGVLFVGVDNEGQVVGVENAKKLLEDIPNKISATMGLIIDVNLKKENEKEYLTIQVPVSSVPVAYHGKYYYSRATDLGRSAVVWKRATTLLPYIGRKNRHVRSGICRPYIARLCFGQFDTNGRQGHGNPRQQVSCPPHPL